MHEYIVEDTLNHVFCLVKPVTSLSRPKVAPGTSASREAGEKIPIILQCWNTCVRVSRSGALFKYRAPFALD